jgi:hypothetical protein
MDGRCDLTHRPPASSPWHPQPIRRCWPAALGLLHQPRTSRIVNVSFALILMGSTLIALIPNAN